MAEHEEPVLDLHGDLERQIDTALKSTDAAETTLGLLMSGQWADEDMRVTGRGADMAEGLRLALYHLRNASRIIGRRLDELTEDEAPDLVAIGDVIDRYHEGEIQPTDALGEIYRMFPGGQVTQ